MTGRVSRDRLLGGWGSPVQAGTGRAHRVLLAIAVGLGLGFGLFQLTQSFDGEAYWQAALRLRAGQPLYIVGLPSDPLVYRYPAWFAWAWVPLTYLSHGLVMVVWRVSMALLALSITPPLWGQRWGQIGVILFVPSLVSAGWMGNAQPLVVALAIYGVRSRHPIALGIAAGIKALPLALVAVYLCRRQWRAAIISVGVGLICWLTILPYLVGYPATRPPWPTDLALLLAMIPQSSVSPTLWRDGWVVDDLKD